MTFVKGQSGNIEGRPPGSKNKKTEAWEKLGEYIVGKGAERYMELLLTSEDKKFADEFKSIVEYFKPRQMRTEIKGEITTGPKKIGFEE